MRMGLPDGAIRPQAHRIIEATEARTSVAEVVADRDLLSQRERELLLAWLSAWQHHWPSSFEHTLGSLGSSTITWLRAQPADPNRFLKLRRIAIENLSRIHLPTDRGPVTGFDERGSLGDANAFPPG